MCGDFKHVQFSDHEITSVKAAHFQYFHGGKSQEAFYDSCENWPTLLSFQLIWFSGTGNVTIKLYQKRDLGPIYLVSLIKNGE